MYQIICILIFFDYNNTIIRLQRPEVHTSKEVNYSIKKIQQEIQAGV